VHVQHQPFNPREAVKHGKGERLRLFMFNSDELRLEIDKGSDIIHLTSNELRWICPVALWPNNSVSADSKIYS